MAWPVGSLLGRFAEAIAWFKARVPLTRDEADSINNRAREDAFWVTGTNSLGVIAHLQQTLATAIENGEPFEAWQARARDALPDVAQAHAETVYRNATQRSYNRGRREQLRNPTVARARPYWQYIAITDGRTTSLCRELHGTILAADDPRWDDILPPNHHNCRSTIRALRPSEAEARGGVTPLPDVEFPAGWGPQPEGEALAANYGDALVEMLKAKRNG